MQETWLPVKNFENYHVSNTGKIKKILKNEEKQLKLMRNSCGYFKIKLWKNNKAKDYYIHRLVASAFVHKGRLDQKEVNHLNRNKADNSSPNLEWVNRQENAIHAYKSSHLVVSQKNADAIVADHYFGRNKYELALKYNLSLTTVTNIIINVCIHQ